MKPDKDKTQKLCLGQQTQICGVNKMTVLKIALKPFHHACGHQASFSVGKMDDSIFSINFFYIIFVYQKCPMATHKIAVQYAC